MRRFAPTVWLAFGLFALLLAPVNVVTPPLAGGARLSFILPAAAATPTACPSAMPLGPYPNVTPPPGTPASPPPGTTYTGNPAAEAAAGQTAAEAMGLYSPGPQQQVGGCSGPPVQCASAGGGSGRQQVPLLECLWQTANAFRGTSTAWPGTACNDGSPDDHLGNCACAAAVQRIIYLATGAMIGSYAVDSFDMAFALGEYGAISVPPGAAHRGAIVIFSATSSVGGGTHIGFCAVDGCAETWSNSSSMSVFGYQTLPLYFLDPNVRVYEPSHIP